MAAILNIETSSTVCSTVIAKDGEIVFLKEDLEGMNHAVKLAPFVEEAISFCKEREIKLDAIAVSMGPGSYTGLRIGLSLAKGLAFSLSIPLIGISTLEILAVRAMFSRYDWEGDEIIVPMVDARRMEVFTCALDFALNRINEEQPLILDSDSFSELGLKRKVIFIGDGSEKFRDLYKHENAIWMGVYKPHARDMVTLAEKYFRESKFIDLAYSVPNYIKSYQTTVSKRKLI